MNHNWDEIAADYPQNEGQEQAECLPEKDLVLGNLVIMTESKYIFKHVHSDVTILYLHLRFVV